MFRSPRNSVLQINSNFNQGDLRRDNSMVRAMPHMGFPKKPNAILPASEQKKVIKGLTKSPHLSASVLSLN